MMARRIEFKILKHRLPWSLTVQTESQDLISVKNYVIYDCPFTKKTLTQHFIVRIFEVTSERVIVNTDHCMVLNYKKFSKRMFCSSSPSVLCCAQELYLFQNDTVNLINLIYGM